MSAVSRLGPAPQVLTSYIYKHSNILCLVRRSFLAPFLPPVLFILPVRSGHHRVSPSIGSGHSFFFDQQSGWVAFGYGLQPTFSVLVSSSMLVSTSHSVLVFLLIFPVLDGWLADLGMEEVTLVCRVVCHADRFCRFRQISLLIG